MFVTADTNHIVVPWRVDLVQVIPHAREFDYQGERMLLIPNRHEEAKVCRNVGVPVPAPILTRYSWAASDGRKPWDIQKTTAALLTESHRAYVLSTMGTGKTRAAAFAADYLMMQPGIRRTLISAPLSTLDRVWSSELFRMWPQARVRVLYGDRAKRLKLLAEDADWYIINHHGVILLQDELAARGFGVIVVDELASRALRNKSTEMWKAHNRVISSSTVKHAWGMTGSPTPKAPTDAWAQIKLLTPDRTVKTMTRFKDLTMRQVSNFKWLRRPEANDIVFGQMQPSVRFTLDDVMELPPTSYVTQQVKLSPEAAKAYKLLFDKMATLTSRGESITAVNEGVLQTKLLQVACGYVYTDKKKVYELPATERRDALLELAEQTDGKSIVYVPFIHALQGVHAYLRKKGVDAQLVYGGTSLGQRNKIFRAFQETEDIKVLVAHPQCMAHGLTLTAAKTIVWYSPTNDYEIYEQANARIRRPGQTSKTLIGHLVGTPVEKLTYNRLRDRGTNQGFLLELFRNQELDF